MFTPKVVTIIVISALVLIFMVQNSEVLQVNFLLWSFQTSRIALIVISLVAGILIGRLTAGWPHPKGPPEA